MAFSRKGRSACPTYSGKGRRDSASAITRLLDIGVPPYLISATLLGVVAQRLVRQICPECAIDTVLTHEEMQVLNLPPDPEQVARAPEGG